MPRRYCGRLSQDFRYYSVNLISFYQTLNHPFPFITFNFHTIYNKFIKAFKSNGCLEVDGGKLCIVSRISEVKYGQIGGGMVNIIPAKAEMRVMYTCMKKR